MTLGRIPGTCSQRVEAGVEKLEQLRRRPRPEPRGSELDRERDPVEPVTDLGEQSASRASTSTPEAVTLLANSSRAAAASSGRTSTTRSAESLRTLLLVTSSVSLGAASMIGTSSAAASTTCSKLSSTTRISQPASSALIASLQLADSPSRTPRVRPSAGTTCAGSESGARSTSSAPSASCSPSSLAASIASRVLPIPAGPTSETSRDPRFEQEPSERAKVAISADRARRRRRHPTACRRAGARCGQRRVLRQDPAFEVAELGPGLETELGVEVGAALPVARERVGLPAGPIERGHQLRAKALPERMLGHEPVEIRDELLMPAEPQPGLAPPLDALEPELLQPQRLGSSEELAAELAENIASPQGESACEDGVREPVVRRRRALGDRRRADARSARRRAPLPRRAADSRPAR